MKIFVTGGAGYLGSHMTLGLLKMGHEVVVLDNLSNSSLESLQRVSKISGLTPEFILGDVRDGKLLKKILIDYSIDTVLHFAGLKSVSESCSQPLRYYDYNIHGTQVLLDAMAQAGIFRFIFSSSATVYGDPAQIPTSELCPVGNITNPYARSKLMVEDMLRDLAISDQRWRIAILRYFNPVGAHESGLIGEDPNGIPNNLLPFITQVAVGRLSELVIFGNNYPTPDGTGIRDYIHVLDLIDGHLCALQALTSHVGANVWNLGTGKGHSVIEVIHAFENISGIKIPRRFAPPRIGDIAISYTDPSKAKRDLGWIAKRSLYDMISDAWRWQQINPTGYK
jgi:UDP-glucose 4-epimerase